MLAAVVITDIIQFYGAKIEIFCLHYTFFLFKSVIILVQTFALTYINFKGEE